MYEELVQALRTCVEKDKGCDDCPYMVRCLKSIREPFIVMTDAADAIEELSKLADAIPHVCECCVGCEMEKKSGGCDNAFVLSPKRAKEYLSKPRWIPVTERLPEESEGLNWHEDMMIRFTSVWCCNAKTGTIEVRNRLQGKMTGNEYLDQYTKDTSWRWSKSLWEPTHWMPIVPLPTPPKEDA